MTRGLRPCGTIAAYQRHLRHGETPCERCKQARRDYMNGYERNKARSRARMRALIHLAVLYPDTYDVLFAEEKAKEGL